MFRIRNQQTGAGKIGLIIALLILAIAIFIAYKIIPVKIKTYEFRDTMREEARMGSLRRTADATMEVILAKAKELDLPITQKNVEVIRTERTLTIKANYTVHLDFKVYEYDWVFNQQESAPLF